MKYTIEMDSGVMIYILGFTRIDLGIRKLGGDSQSEARRRHGELTSLLLFFSKMGKAG
jgi:hypothetical protein